MASRQRANSGVMQFSDWNWISLLESSEPRHGGTCGGLCRPRPDAGAIQEAARSSSRVMSKEEVERYVKVLHPRERVIALLALFVGLRPGEILALQRRHVSSDCTRARIEQRLYQGDIDTPKTHNSTRIVAIPPRRPEASRNGWNS